MTAVVRGRAALDACQCGGLNGHHQVCPRYFERESRLAHEVIAERDAALAAIERVRAMHTPRMVAVADGTRDETICTECGVVTFGQVRAGDWPCATIQALGDQT